jgi:hypothetical protein
MELLVPSQEGMSVGDRQILKREFVIWKIYGMKMSQLLIRNYFKIFLNSPKETAKTFFFEVGPRFEFKVTKLKSL